MVSRSARACRAVLYGARQIMKLGYWDQQYFEAKRNLIGRIKEMSPGSMLPTAADLAQEYGTNKKVIDRIMQEVGAAGFVSGGSGRRRYVLDWRSRVVHTVGIMSEWDPSTPSVSHWSALRLLGEIERHGTGYRVHFVPVRHSAKSYKQLASSYSVQGIIAIHPSQDVVSELELFQDVSGIPVLAVGWPMSDRLLTVMPDIAGGVRLAVDYLVYTRSHSRIALIAIRPERPVVAMRCRAYVELTHSGMFPDVLGTVGRLYLGPTAVDIRKGDEFYDARDVPWSRSAPFALSVSEWFHDIFPLSERPTALIVADADAAAAVLTLAESERDFAGFLDGMDIVYMTTLGELPQSQDLTLTQVVEDYETTAALALSLLVASIRGTRENEKYGTNMKLINPLSPISDKD